METGEMKLVDGYRIPDWAIKKSNGELEVGAQLCTKDGRHIGNAHIIDMAISKHSEHIIYTVLTDAGNRIHLSGVEINQLFYAPMWVADYTDVIVKFGRT